MDRSKVTCGIAKNNHNRGLIVSHQCETGDVLAHVIKLDPIAKACSRSFGMRGALLNDFREFLTCFATAEKHSYIAFPIRYTSVLQQSTLACFRHLFDLALQIFEGEG